MSANVATASASPATVTELRRTNRLIDPANVVLDIAGGARSHYVVYLPEGMIGNDLQEWSIWSRVQKSQRPLRPDDAILAKSYDRTWRAYAEVVDSDETGASLDIIRVREPRVRRNDLPHDDKHYTKSVGRGWKIFRRSDNQPTSASVWLTERELEQAWANLYPRPVER